MGRPIHSPATVKKVRRWAGTLTDQQMGEKLGLRREQVAHIRRKHRIAGVPAGSAPSFWISERVAILIEHYIEGGKPAVEVAEMIGCDTTAERVRKKASEMGLKRDPEATRRNYLARRHVGARAKRARPEPPKRVGASDAELVAQYLAANEVTQCAPGWAAGITAWEMAIRTAPPPGSSLRDQQARNKKRQRAA